VDETTGQLHAHLKTAGASKKAKAKEEKETDAVMVSLHCDHLALNPSKVKGNPGSVGGEPSVMTGNGYQYVLGIS
jgi:hypothetical protein